MNETTDTTEIQRIAESADDDRVRIELRPDPDSEGYELLLSTSNGTTARALSYAEGGRIIAALGATITGDDAPRGFQ